MSMKIGKYGWFLFGTKEYPISESVNYQIEGIEVEYGKHQNFDYLFGLGCTF